jgi:hypothetical protein
MAGEVFDVFCLLLGDEMSLTSLLPPIHALFESSSARFTRAVRCEVRVHFRKLDFTSLDSSHLSDHPKSHIITKQRARAVPDKGGICPKMPQNKKIWHIIVWQSKDE